MVVTIMAEENSVTRKTIIVKETDYYVTTKKNKI